MGAPFVIRDKIKSALLRPVGHLSPVRGGKETERADSHDVCLTATPENPYANLPGAIA